MNSDIQKKNFEKRICEPTRNGLVSVIIPTYNRARWLVEAMASVYAQRYRPIELLVVDDGSTDNTKDFVEQWQKQCAHDAGFSIRYMYQQNAGGGAARNLGLTESHGEFIQFLDSDDVLAPSKISEQVRVFSTCNERSAMYGAWRFFKDTQEHVEIYDAHLQHNGDMALKNWLGEGFVPSHSLLWRKKDIANIGPWDESLAADQDGDFAMRFLSNGGTLVFCPMAWVYYRLHEKPDSSVGANNNYKAFESRYRVTRRIEEVVTSKGMLNDYRDVFSLRYALLARRYAMADKELTNLCLERSRTLAPTGKLPDVFSYSFLSRVLGLTTKQRMARRLRSIFGIKKRSDTEQMSPVAVVATVTQVSSFDECTK
jgi:glycosyltransferase involved in cell wall biosynthesis